MSFFGFLIFSLALLFPVFAFAAVPSQYGLQEGELISASGDPDIYIINEHGFKRLFLNPAIFGFYGHLRWENVKEVSAQTRDAFPTSLYFKNCEIGGSRVYAVEVTGEDASTLHWLNASLTKLEGEDSNFSKKVFCINDKEFRWYSISGDYSSTSQVSEYKRGIFVVPTQTTPKEKKLVRLADDPKIYYLTESGVKKHIISPEVFNSYKGNKWEDIIVIDKIELDSYPTANLFRRAGDTNIYKLEDGNKRLIPDVETFNKLGFDWDRIVEINEVEFAAYATGDIFISTKQKDNSYIKKESTTPPAIEPIIFALNKGYADKFSNWKQQADKVINDINFVFRKTTQKQFRISKYLVYNDSEYTSLFSSPEKYPEFYQDVGNRGGLTYILLAHKDGISNEELKQLYGSDNVNLAWTVHKEGKTYPTILQGNQESFNILLDEYRPSNIYMPIHEIGHFLGLAVPELYFYQYSDCTGVDPRFQDYNVVEDPYFLNEPMGPQLTDINIMRFSELNSAIINKNLNFDYTFEDVRLNWFSRITKVYVTDKAGSPIQGATVEIFPVLKGCWFCSTNCSGVKYGHGVLSNPTPEQVLVTDKNGYVTYDGPVGAWSKNETEDTAVITKAIKVFYDGKSSARTVKFIDLQKNYVINNSNEHVTHIILE